MTDMAALGFVGLGTIGKPMALRLAAADGIDLTVYDVVPEPVAELVAAGATAAPGLEAVDADVVCVMVRDDDQVRAVTRYEPGRSSLRDIVFNGGGGTDFTPLLEEAQRHRPDIVVVLTDLKGPANFRPRCPVVWAVPRPDPGTVPPFGRLLPLN